MSLIKNPAVIWFEINNRSYSYASREACEHLRAASLEKKLIFILVHLVVMFYFDALIMRFRLKFVDGFAKLKFNKIHLGFSSILEIKVGGKTSGRQSDKREIWVKCHAVKLIIFSVYPKAWIS